MSASELDDVLSLLERILPDPSGFGERLVQQAVLQWAGGASRHPVVAGAVAGAAPEESPPSPPPEEAAATPGVTTLLAFALGACDCWGREPECGVCRGEGGPGWADPDAELFQEYVGPAVARLGALWEAPPADDAARPRSDTTSDHERPPEGAER